ncbi:aureocin A53 family class IId bacteriocin [Salimicrobium jeotgali]|uniref:aureocin A53 family class IId bacteriocin n=1 Tax=Salimicrobium jeotgali TaxID=1230341 RepID=UPI0012E289F5|nr:aureocin A53 family class IId bacteriocin [Salimicrobium jeotgali]MBM7697620.1 hypothetical protein [Salimicrobium jeotgali]
MIGAVTRAWSYISRLSGAAASWARRNFTRVVNWIKDGATFEWISDKIDSILD